MKGELEIKEFHTANPWPKKCTQGALRCHRAKTKLERVEQQTTEGHFWKRETSLIGFS
tara:strand:+ start:3777 stop:3950 length:174 start_codon:yes stop_codon:yes gene_type:complete